MKKQSGKHPKRTIPAFNNEAEEAMWWFQNEKSIANNCWRPSEQAKPKC